MDGHGLQLEGLSSHPSVPHPTLFPKEPVGFTLRVGIPSIPIDSTHPPPPIRSPPSPPTGPLATTQGPIHRSQGGAMQASGARREVRKSRRASSRQCKWKTIHVRNVKHRGESPKTWAGNTSSTPSQGFA